jgi:hypothetical protein
VLSTWESISGFSYWKTPGENVAPLSGRAVRLRFVLSDADVYSFRFK